MLILATSSIIFSENILYTFYENLHTFSCDQYILVLGRVNVESHWRPYEMIYDYYDGQWYPGINGPSFLDICLTIEENSRKNVKKENWPDRESNLGSLGERQSCYSSF